MSTLEEKISLLHNYSACDVHPLNHIQPIKHY